MHFSFDPGWLDELRRHIEALEYTFLESMTPDEFDLADVFDEHEHNFISIRGLTNFWSKHPNTDFVQHITDLVIGAYNQLQEDLVLVMAGTPQRLSIYISLGNATKARAMLEGILPGISIEPAPIKNLAESLSSHFQVKGIITGIPSRKIPRDGAATHLSSAGQYNKSANSENGSVDIQSFSQLERVVRGMYKARWAYVVKAHPRPRNVVTKERLERLDLLARVISQSRFQSQLTQQDTLQETEVKTGAFTQTFSGEMVNYRAQYLVQLLEREIERLDGASAVGQWIVQTYFGAGTFEDAQRLASLLVGTLAGVDSRPSPVRAFTCFHRGEPLSNFNTFLSSDELATLIQLPREEVPGYAISDLVRFDVDFRFSKSTSHTPLTLGYIQHNEQDADPYQININDLTKHGAVIGVTGSGKTTTVMNLLHRVIDAGKPFLVIEPAKTEYRAMRSMLAGLVDVRIYTLGNENVAPFRLNPFEFETDDNPGSASIVNHIDFLKAVFNAAFILYAPMPYVLEIALHEVYEDKGWDLATGLNLRLPRWADRHLYPIFPTLTDLYRKIEHIVDRLGYDTRIEQDVKAGLKARISSMRIGSKGLMLDTARGIPISQLLSYPTVLEMENIGGDDEKTFLMGLLLAKLYEYRRLQAASGKLTSDLQHLLVFEEAHRLLKNAESHVDTESSNLRSQAIEVFTNMLSEMRAYGQGVLVAEQMPSKLAPDVLKNTNLKVAHRLIARDDRDSVGQTMNLNTDQITHLGILSPGTAAVFAEGADHAYLVRIENYKRNLTSLSDDQLKAQSPTYASVEGCMDILDLHHYIVQRSAFGGPPDAVVYQAAARLLDSTRSQWLWATVLLRTVFSRSQLLEALTMLRRQIADEIPSLQTNQREAAPLMTIVRGCAEVLYNRGAAFGWRYPEIEYLRESLTQGLITLVRKKDLSLASNDLDRFTRKYEQLMEREQGPFPGCAHCHAKCVYRLDVRRLLTSVERNLIDGDLTNPAYPKRTDRYAAIARTTKGIAEQWLGASSYATEGIGYCGALHTASDLGLTEYEQSLFADYLHPELSK